MIREMELQEMDKPDIKVVITPRDKVNQSDLEKLLKFFQDGYGERWIGDDNFYSVMMKNATELLELKEGDQTAAALLFDNNRISDISVHPGFQGQGLGVKLFEEAAKAHSDVWISVGVTADGMLATITDKDLKFLPVEDGDKIQELFKSTNRGRDSYQIETSIMEIPLLSDRLKNKGIDQVKFTIFNRMGSTHGSSYKQVLFQNQTQS